MVRTNDRKAITPERRGDGHASLGFPVVSVRSPLGQLGGAKWRLISKLDIWSSALAM